MSQARETDSLPMGKGCHLTFKTSSTLPPDSVNQTWTEVTYDGGPTSRVPSILPHWHKHHDEWMQVLSGRVDFTVSGTATTLTPTSPPLHIPRLHTHSFKFVPGVATVLQERTDPEGDFKERFFRVLFGEGDREGRATVWSLGRACLEGDTFLAVPGGLGRGLDEWVTWALKVVVRWLGGGDVTQATKKA